MVLGHSIFYLLKGYYKIPPKPNPVFPEAETPKLTEWQFPKIREPHIDAKDYNPYYGELQYGTRNFGKPPNHAVWRLASAKVPP